ncbi:hypothetical protein HUW63_05815 [Myxococcus sp. AM001]|nr:hypothetical protein [Myxococcus sp. AM001]
MTKNIVNTALVLLGTGTLLTGCDMEQPATDCFVQGSPSWAMKYDPVDEPRDANGNACETGAPLAELVGVYKFVNPDTDTAQLALRPAGLAGRAIADETTQSSDQTALGSLGEQDAQDFCTATNFNSAFVNVAASGGSPENTVRYAFSEVKVYSAPSAPGTQIMGQFTYTNNGCTGTYVMRGLWPAVGCYTDSTDPLESCGEGSGMNPDAAVMCQPIHPDDPEDPTYGYCVPAKEVPSFK